MSGTLHCRKTSAYKAKIPLSLNTPVIKASSLMAILSPLCSVLLPSCSSTPLYSEESHPIPLFKHQSSLASPCCLWCQHGVVFIYMSVLISSFIVNVVFVLSCTFMQAHAHACVHVHTPIYIKFWHLKKKLITGYWSGMSSKQSQA